MTRVVVDASVLGWPDSGIRRYLDALIARLAQDPRLELVLMTNERRPVTSVPGTMEVARRVKSALLWRNTVLAWASREADVLWCPWPTIPWWGVRGALVVTVHDISPLLHRGSKPLTATLGMAVGGRRAVRMARRVLCISETTASDVAGKFRVPRAGLHAVPLAVDQRFSPGDRPTAQAAVRKRWGVVAPFLLAVGTVEPRKGYDLLPPLANMLPDLPVVVAGRPGPRSTEVLSQLNKSCVVVGGVTDEELLDLYRAAEVLLVPSLYEGFGFTPWEAMACGTPAIVAAGSGALEELVEGTMPVLPRDPRRWADSVRQVVAERSELARIGLLAASRRTWDDVARETADVLVQAGRGARA